MQLVPPRDLLPPSICIICETQPDGEAVVDTLYNLKTGVASIYNGRKYVCERCVGEFAKLFGYEHGTSVQRAEFERDQLRTELSNVKQHVDNFAKELTNAINHPGSALSGVRFEDIFRPPNIEEIRSSTAGKLSGLGKEDIKKPARRAKTERPAVPAPGLTVTEEAPIDNSLTATETEANFGSPGQKDEAASK